MVLEDEPFSLEGRYVYVVRNTCSLTPDVSNICLEMYISYDDYDESILSQQRRVAENLKVPIYVDVYHEHTDEKTMLLYTTYTFNSSD
jgi:hypothetical protein